MRRRFFFGFWMAFLTLSLDSTASDAAQNRDAEGWRVRSASNAGDATALAHGAVPVEVVCSGSPPSFRVVFTLPHAIASPGEDFEGTLSGWLLVQPGPTVPLEWRSSGGRQVDARIYRGLLETLSANAGGLDVRIDSKEGSTFEHGVSASDEFVSAVKRFLSACDHHVRRANRQFELDGIQVELRVEVDEQDLTHIRALAADLGIEDIESIYIGVYGLPASSLAAIVTSRSVQNEAHIRQRRIRVWHEDWPGKEPGERQRGPWHTGAQSVTVLDRWVLRDGDWALEAHLGPGVSVEGALKIFTAIRDGTLVDVRQGPSFALVGLPTRDDLQEYLEAIPSVRVETVEDASDEPAAVYEVSLPTRHLSGKALRVQIVEDRIEVLSVSIWMV